MDLIDTPAVVWQKALDLLKEELPRPAFESWLRGSELQGLDDSAAVLKVNSAYARDMLEKRAAPRIRAALRQVLGQDVPVRFVMAQLPLPLGPQEPPDKPRPRRGRAGQGEDSFASTPLNAKYTFDSFVVGKSNQFAQAAAEAVAHQLGDRYNPLFIYGGSGLGKTHLMQAIGHEAMRLNPGLNVAYVSGDTFTYHVVDSIRKDRYGAFRGRYNNVDVWLVDDIQFIADRERTQVEFFLTFNALYETNKQIVITSDQPPKQLQIMDDRLRSRFECGLIADIKPPDLETRIAILAEKAARDRAVVPTEVIRYIARLVKSNVRVLEGALIQVLAAASLTGEPITLAMATELLRNHSGVDPDRPITVVQVQEVVAAYFQISLAELTGSRRTKDLVEARQIAMYLARELTGLPYQEIGRHFGGRDHSTVMHACRKVEQQMAQDPSVKALVADLRARLAAREG